MDNPYISYKVIGDTFTYKRFNKKNVVVNEEIPLFENGRINPAAIQIVDNVRKNKKIFEKNQVMTAPIEAKENNNPDTALITLSNDEYNIIDKFIKADGNKEEIQNLRKKVKEIEDKYNISFEQLRKIYKKERHNNIEKSYDKRDAIIDLLEKRNEARKLIEKLPDNLISADLNSHITEIEKKLGLSKEYLLNLYSETHQKEVQKDKTDSIKLFHDKLNNLTVEDIENIRDFINTVPPTEELFNKVEQIKEKYKLTDKEIILAYTIKKKELSNKPKHKSVKNSKLKNIRTAQKLETMILALRQEELSEEELNTKLTELAKKYNVSQLQMEMLYNNAKIKQEYNALDKKVSKKLTGQKIPSHRKRRKEIIKENGLDSKSSKQQVIEKGLDLVIESKKEEWEEFVNNSYSNPVPIYTALNVMSILKNGGGISSARKEIENSHNFEINKKDIINIVSKYSPYGQEFAKKTKKYIMSNPERLLKFVLDKKGGFHKEEEDDFDIENAIDRLKNLKYSILTPDEMEMEDVIEPPRSTKQI